MLGAQRQMIRTRPTATAVVLFVMADGFGKPGAGRQARGANTGTSRIQCPRRRPSPDRLVASVRQRLACLSRVLVRVSLDKRATFLMRAARLQAATWLRERIEVQLHHAARNATRDSTSRARAFQSALGKGAAAAGTEDPDPTADCTHRAARPASRRGLTGPSHRRRPLSIRRRTAGWSWALRFLRIARRR